MNHLVWIILTAALFSSATSVPLNEQEIAQLQAHVSPSSEHQFVADGYRFSDGTSRAEVYGPINETASGTCFSKWLILYGNVVDGHIQWKDVSGTQIYTRVWLEPERNGRPCSDMTSQPNITLSSPLEEQTLLRISAARRQLFIEAISFLPGSYSVAESEEAQLEGVDIADFHVDSPSHYKLKFWINESACRGISVDVATDAKGGLYVTGAWGIAC
jgi:hypothetical protein